VIIGSIALEHRLGDIGREPRDDDFVCTYDDAAAYLAVRRYPEVYPIAAGKKLVARDGDRDIVEFELAWEGTTSRELIELVRTDPTTVRTGFFGQYLWPSLDVLYALKMSHRYLKDSPHFLKTMRDIHLMRRHGAEIRPEHLEWFRKREKETYWYKHPKLDQMKKDFFSGDGVQYVYDHDTIHESVRHLERPAYTYFKRPGSEVMCDRSLFEAAAEETRLFSVLEEAQVLAIERSQVPFRGKKSPRWSFDLALMKVCTSITSGWWREYAWEHYDQVQALYHDDYVEKFWRDVGSGLVRKL